MCVYEVDTIKFLFFKWFIVDTSDLFNFYEWIDSVIIFYSYLVYITLAIQIKFVYFI